MTLYTSTLTALGTEAIRGAREATPAELAAATLADAAALWAVVDGLSGVKVARWVDTYGRRSLRDHCDEEVAGIGGGQAWWEASTETGIEIRPSQWTTGEWVVRFEPAPDPAAAEAHISELFRAAGWRIS